MRRQSAILSLAYSNIRPARRLPSLLAWPSAGRGAAQLQHFRTTTCQSRFLSGAGRRGSYPLTFCAPTARYSFRSTSLRHCLLRSASTAAAPRKRSVFVRFCLRAFATIGFIGLVFAGSVIAFFVYDASTYHRSSKDEPISVLELALHPRRGGPKNLPIAEFLVDDVDSPEQARQKDKPRLVVLGAGWGVSSAVMLLCLLASESRIVRTENNMRRPAERCAVEDTPAGTVSHHGRVTGKVWTSSEPRLRTWGHC